MCRLQFVLLRETVETLVWLTFWHFRWSCDGSQFQPISTGTILQRKRERETEHSADSSHRWRSDTLMFTEIESLNNILYQKWFLFVFIPSPIVFLSHFSFFLLPFLHYLINYLKYRDSFRKPIQKSSGESQPGLCTAIMANDFVPPLYIFLTQIHTSSH